MCDGCLDDNADVEGEGFDGRLESEAVEWWRRNGQSRRGWKTVIRLRVPGRSKGSGQEDGGCASRVLALGKAVAKNRIGSDETTQERSEEVRSGQSRVVEEREILMV